MTNTNESAENYLETILVLSKKLPVVRAVDISNELGFKKSSVSIAMKNLRLKNQITVTDAGFIYLTDDFSVWSEGLQADGNLLVEFTVEDEGNDERGNLTHDGCNGGTLCFKARKRADAENKERVKNDVDGRADELGYH